MTKTILAIDTSCDETSVAVTRGTVVLSNVIASQVQLHKEYGGVFPTVAKQAHRENILPTVSVALKRARLSWSDLDALAITQGPGLAPALEVGIEFAQQLATEHSLPLVPINHIEGHVLSVLAQPHSDSARPSIKTMIDWPVLSVVVSGGHTEYVLLTAPGQYQRLGWTIDDAAGEVLDKVGRMLDLGYPAGPVVEEFAKLGDASRFAIPLPMTTSGDYNLSFSGMKTFARNTIEKLDQAGQLNKQAIYDFCASFQYGVFRAVIYKMKKILDQHPVKEVWLGGGVAANMTLRKMLRVTLKNYGLTLRVPYTKKLCGDNAAMIGLVAGFKLDRGETLPAPHTIERQPRWPLTTT